MPSTIGYTDAQFEQVTSADLGFGQMDDQFHQRATHPPAELVDAFGRGRLAAVADPAVGRQLAADSLDRIERDAEVHNPAHVADGQLEADQDDHFVGRHDLNQLWIAFHPLYRQFEIEHVFPGVAQLVEEEARNT